ncbi:CHAT domain-containing protein [Synechococcus sp. CC9616]|uniref:CHAT domain-containing protein n=1 Tax=Synechococcus sp. CC9616 TaxID=110663 RepID=UPI000A010B7B|nr:CHAT domain-containing protein [Synechococcus sp. CC9616]
MTRLNASRWTIGLACCLASVTWTGLTTLVTPQKGLAQVSGEVSARAQLPRFERQAYNPAVLHVRFTEAAGRTSSIDTDAFLDLTLILASGAVEGLRMDLSLKQFQTQLRKLYTQLSRLEPLNEADPASPSRQLHAVLIAELMPVLLREKVTTLLIAADRGLQAVPFAALSDGERFFGDRFAFSITPSLALTTFNPSDEPGQRLLAFGASQFDGLASLPLVPQELNRISSRGGKDQFLNKDFTPSTLLEKASSADYDKLHVATHAEFKPGGPKASQLHSGTGPISMEQLTALRQSRRGVPLDLVVFSACRTALGDADAELGFSGLALQAGARSAVGTLWYVDDVVTSAYFVQMYRYLNQDVPKAEAMQLTRQAFIRGLIRLVDDQVVGADGSPLLTELTPAQQRRVADGVGNPFFWAGIELMGAPW